MNNLPSDVQAHIMRMYFTQHVLSELTRFDFKRRRTNIVVGNYVDILTDRIRRELNRSNADPDILRWLRYARDRWSTYLFPERGRIFSSSAGIPLAP